MHIGIYWPYKHGHICSAWGPSAASLQPEKRSAAAGFASTKNGLRFNQKSFAFRIHLRISHSHASSCSSSSSSPFLLLVPPPHHSFFISSPPSSLRSSTPSFSYYVPLSSAPSPAARASSYAMFKVCVWVGLSVCLGWSSDPLGWFRGPISMDICAAHGVRTKH